MKKTLILFTFAICSVASFAQTKNPKFKFIKESISLGKIPQGVPANTVFEFKNEGTLPLIISDVKPTCGCTATEYTKVPIKQGQKGFIKVNYNAATFGPFNKTITIVSNSIEPTKVITITGEVLQKSK